MMVEFEVYIAHIYKAALLLRARPRGIDYTNITKPVDIYYNVLVNDFGLCYQFYFYHFRLGI